MGAMTQGAIGSPLPERPIFFHHPHYTHASSPHSIIIQGDYKMIRYYNDRAGRFALFNLRTDPEEQHDLWLEKPGLVRSLDEALQAHLLAAGAEFPIPVDSPEGRRLLDAHAAGTIRGYNPRYAEDTEVMNKTTERDLALIERAVQARKLGLQP